MLNISGSREVVDPTYRYKMPRMVTRTEGKGNGVRTCIVNMKEISDSLLRMPDIVTKFFGVELGAQSRWESEVGIVSFCMFCVEIIFQFFFFGLGRKEYSERYACIRCIAKIT